MDFASKFLYTSLGLHNDDERIEAGNQFGEEGSIVYTFEFGENWKSSEEGDDSKKLELLSAAFGIVLHWYNGDDRVCFLLQSPEMVESDSDLKFNVVTINFVQGMHFSDILTQVQASSIKGDTLGIQDLNLDTIRKCAVSSTSRNLNYHSLLKKGLKNCLEIQLGFGSTIPGELCIRLNYAPEEFAQTQMARLATNIATILGNGLQFPEKPVEELRMLTPTEENRVLFEFNEIHGRDESLYSNAGSLFGIFYRHVVERGQKVAVVQELAESEIQLTYQELFLLASTLSNSIQKMESLKTLTVNEGNSGTPLEGIPNYGSNQFVAICLPQGVSLLSSTLAILMINKTVAILHSSYPREQVESCLKTLGSPILITTQEKLNEIGLNYPYTFLTNDQELVKSAQNLKSGLGEFKNFETREISNKNPYCLFTSGSTGDPKAVLLTQTALLNRSNFYIKTSHVDSNSRQLLIASPGFVMSAAEVWMTWTAGGSHHIPSDSTKVHIPKLSRWIHDQEITIAFIPPTMLRNLLMENPQLSKYLSKLKLLITGGEKLHEMNLKSQNFDCLLLYGATETFEVSAKFLKAGKKYQRPPVGSPIANNSVYVLDNLCQPVPIGVAGDIYMSGAGLMERYLNAPGQVGLQPNPFVEGAQMYKLGDVGYWNEEGELCVLGRNDSQVKLYGVRLELGEVESVLEKCPGIKQAIVTLREFQNVKQLIANCTLNDPSCCPTLADVTSFLTSKLPRHAIPCEVNFVSEFNKTHSGKVSRRNPVSLPIITIPELGDDMILNVEMRQIWTSVLEVPQELIRPDSNFFYLGGNSLHASNLTQILQKKYPNIQLSQIFAKPVLSDFVNALSLPDGDQPDIDCEQEIELELNFDKCTNRDPPRSIKKSLLTGSTGYFGPALLLQLLSSTSQTIVCIIRAPNSKKAEERLKTAMAVNHSTDIFDKFQNTRIEILAGDVASPSFGLHTATYQGLCESVDAIYHSAAYVNHMTPYANFKFSTVVMMKNVLEFATAGKLKWIHYMSSVAVFDGIPLPDGAEFYAAEEILLPREIDPSRMLYGYAQSKWVCEKLLEKARKGGIPGAIYRLGEIGSHSTLNIVNRDDVLGNFTLACRRVGGFPNVRCKVPYVRLDIAAKMVVELGESLLAATSVGLPVFHILETEIGLEEFLMEDDSKEYEPLDLVSWELKFLSTFRWDAKEDISAYALLNSLKSIAKQDRTCSIFKNVSFSYRKGSGGEKSDNKEICKAYFRALFNALQMINHWRQHETKLTDRWSFNYTLLKKNLGKN